ncbi:MAG: class I SAM-dependent methyltransferase [Thermoleophilaceae bacterium]
MLGDDLLRELGGSVPGDHSRQTLADEYIGRLVAGTDSPRVLDLGCGAGDSVDAFRAANPGVRWLGLDLVESPEVAARTRTDAEFLTFDGVAVPAEDESFDIVFSKQVLEHVRRPRELLAEAARVLAPGGVLAGSTSQLEPFHSYSLWNYTPYGFAALVEEAGLELLELRPGIDALTLILRRATGRPRFMNRWWASESPLNRLAGLGRRPLRLDDRQLNAIKLVLCGQFSFLARRPPPAADGAS